jgi:hypothetical protein
VSNCGKGQREIHLLDAALAWSLPALRTARMTQSSQHPTSSTNFHQLLREMSVKTFNARAAICAFSSLLVVSAFAQPAEPLKIQESVDTLTATVESIDVKQRLLELRSGDRRTTVQVPDEVRNLDQVKVGDEIVVQYHEGLAAQLKKKGESRTVGSVNVENKIARSAEGAMPGGTAANTVTTTVIIESVDQPNNSVTFTGPSGMTRTVEVKDPSARQFIGTLTKGDEVEITYREALAVRVEPKAPAR